MVQKFVLNNIGKKGKYLIYRFEMIVPYESAVHNNRFIMDYLGELARKVEAINWGVMSVGEELEKEGETVG